MSLENFDSLSNYHNVFNVTLHYKECIIVISYPNEWHSRSMMETHERVSFDDEGARKWSRVTDLRAKRDSIRFGSTTLRFRSS